MTGPDSDPGISSNADPPNPPVDPPVLAPPPLPSPPSPEATQIAEPPRRPRVILGTVGALVLASVLGMIVWAIATPRDAPADAPLSLPVFLMMIVIPSLTFGALALLWCRNAPEGMARRLLLVKPNVRGRALWLLLPATWAAWLAGVPLLLLGDKIFGGGADALKGFIEQYSAAPWSWKWAFLVGSTLGPGIGEELLFRGYLQQGLLKSHRTRTAILITVALFSLAHLPPARVLGVIPLAVWMSFLAVRTGSLIPGMLCHTFVNLSGHSLIATGADYSVPVIVAGVLGLPAFWLAIRELRGADTKEPAPPSMTAEAGPRDLA